MKYLYSAKFKSFIKFIINIVDSFDGLCGERYSRKLLPITGKCIIWMDVTSYFMHIHNVTYIYMWPSVNLRYLAHHHLRCMHLCECASVCTCINMPIHKLYYDITSVMDHDLNLPKMSNEEFHWTVEIKEKSNNNNSKTTSLFCRR